MKNYDYIVKLSIDELAEWIDKYGEFDDFPWLIWFDKKYCNNCDAETIYIPAFDKETECSYCELHNNCKYFSKKDDVPNTLDIIKLWLKEEIEDTEGR